MIELKNISVVFNPGGILQTKAINRLSLKVNQGEFISIIGSNGAGKSTLMSVIAGEIKPVRGSVLFEDEDVSNIPGFRRAWWLGKVFQDPRSGTFHDLTIEENLALALMRGKPRKLGRSLTRARRALFKERLAELGLGLENRLGDKMDLLSGGQRQTVSLVMATMSPLQLLLLDEHTAALDPRTAGFVLALTQRLVETYRLTALMITHKMSDALSIGSRTIMMHQGRITCDLAGEQRKNQTIAGLVEKFKAEHQSAAALGDDEILLS